MICHFESGDAREQTAQAKRRSFHGARPGASVQWVVAPALACVAVICTAAPAISAQVVPGNTAPACPACRVTFTRIGQIDGADDEHGFPGQMASIIRDVRGQFWVGFHSASEPLIYDAMGRIVRSVGRIGSGPGEVSGPDAWPMRGRGDTMLVVDQRNARLNVYSGNGAFVRSQRSTLRSAVFGVIQLPDGRFVSAGFGQSRRGEPLQLHDSTGRRVRAIGPMSLDEMQRHPMIAAVGNGFWAVDRLRYTIQVYESPDRPPVAVPHRPAWFTPSDSLQSHGPERVPQTQVMSLTADGRGRMWIVTAVPDPKWRTSWGRPRRMRLPFGGSAMRPHFERYEDFYDTQIEVFDIASRRLLASWKTDLAVWSIFPGGVLVAVHGDGTLFSIHRVTLTGLPE